MLNESIVYLLFQLIECMILMLFDLKFVVIISMHLHSPMNDVDKQPEQ
jgi:hypothetical protein